MRATRFRRLPRCKLARCWLARRRLRRYESIVDALAQTSIHHRVAWRKRKTGQQLESRTRFERSLVSLTKVPLISDGEARIPAGRGQAAQSACHRGPSSAIKHGSDDQCLSAPPFFEAIIIIFTPLCVACFGRSRQPAQCCGRWHACAASHQTYIQAIV